MSKSHLHVSDWNSSYRMLRISRRLSTNHTRNIIKFECKKLRLLLFQEDLLKSVSHKMEKIREAFPRLYFLSDDEVVDVLINSNDPRKLMPVVRKCFSGIQSLKFSFPDEGAKPNTALDAALKSMYASISLE